MPYETTDWAEMRAALPDRLAAMGYNQTRTEAFMAKVPETYREPAGLGSIALAGEPQPDFVTYGPEPLYHVFGSEALLDDIRAATDALLTDLEQGEI
ncbi:MAG TPA: hypothetical protein VJ843_01695 [Candidatus Saccharimonadales bacterium]|nr:hypothetical protein [Candidatus Saccharimonadales bacterium]